MKENDTTKPPRRSQYNNMVPEEEAKLGSALNRIRQQLIKPYQKLKIEEEKEEYKRKHPELEEVMTIVEEIDRNNIKIKKEQPYYINALEIKKWMEKNNTTKPPRSQYNNMVPEEEAKLGSNLSSIRHCLIKPYQKLKTEEEKEEYKKQHPELEEVMAIVEEIDRNKGKKVAKDVVIKQKEEEKLGENEIVQSSVFEQTIIQAENGQNIDNIKEK